jgi:hypothetical protein
LCPQTSNDGNTTTSTLSLIVQKDDAGKYLTCQAKNTIFQKEGLEDGWQLEIQCEYSVLMYYGALYRNQFRFEDMIIPMTVGMCMPDSILNISDLLQLHKWTQLLLNKTCVYEEFLFDYLEGVMSFNGSKVSDQQLAWPCVFTR